MCLIFYLCSNPPNALSESWCVILYASRLPLKHQFVNRYWWTFFSFLALSLGSGLRLIRNPTPKYLPKTRVYLRKIREFQALSTLLGREQIVAIRRRSLNSFTRKILGCPHQSLNLVRREGNAKHLFVTSVWQFVAIWSFFLTFPSAI